MTPSQLATFEEAQARSLRPWLARALEAIEAKVDDARAHGVKAVTETLKQTPDGRATLRKAAGSRSLQAAQSRLDELWSLLCGASAASLDGLLRDARESFYIESFERWKPFIPSELWMASDPQPTQANIRLVRAMPVHGYELRHEFEVPIRRAKASLRAGVTQAGRRSTPDSISTDLINGWAETARQSLFRVAQSALSDGQKLAETLAGRDLVHPDYLDESPVG